VPIEGLERSARPRDTADDRLPSQLIGANLGGIIVVLAFVRAARCPARGKHELHFMHQAAPWHYAYGLIVDLSDAHGALLAGLPAATPACMACCSTSFVVSWRLLS
jgi:hypothetical protein